MNMLSKLERENPKGEEKKSKETKEGERYEKEQSGQCKRWEGNTGER